MKRIEEDKSTDINTNMEGYYYTHSHNAFGPVSTEEDSIKHAKEHLGDGAMIMIFYGTPIIKNKTLNFTNLNFVRMYFVQDALEEDVKKKKEEK